MRQKKNATATLTLRQTDAISLSKKLLKKIHHQKIN
jgi:hypothetical protein